MHSLFSEEDVEKYVKYSPEELTALAESYKVQIRSKIDDHWLTKIERKYKKNLFGPLLSAIFILFIAGIIILSTIILITTMQKQFLRFVPASIITVLFMLVIGFLLQSLDDGTRQLRQKVRTIELVLEKKTRNPQKSIMVDSNIPDKFISGELTQKDIEKALTKGYEFYITHIQIDQISLCEDIDIRQKLNLFVGTIRPHIIATESTIPNLSRLGYSKLGPGDKLKYFESEGHPDALIAETALMNKFILLTEDADLRKKFKKQNGTSWSVQEFKEKID